MINWIEFWLSIKKDRADWAPAECPNCGAREHLRIRIDDKGNVDPVECDKCGWDDYSSHKSRLESVIA